MNNHHHAVSDVAGVAMTGIDVAVEEEEVPAAVVAVHIVHYHNYAVLDHALHIGQIHHHRRHPHRNYYGYHLVENHIDQILRRKHYQWEKQVSEVVPCQRSHPPWFVQIRHHIGHDVKTLGCYDVDVAAVDDDMVVVDEMDDEEYDRRNWILYPTRHNHYEHKVHVEVADLRSEAIPCVVIEVAEVVVDDNWADLWDHHHIHCHHAHF
jgi:hypothetical protein